MITCICGVPVVRHPQGRPRKYCSDHCRGRARRQGLTAPVPARVVALGFLRCTRCDQVKADEAFPVSDKYTAGRASWCKECYRLYRLARRDRQRMIERRVRYGISLEDQEAMWAAQGGLCASCEKPFPSDRETHLDHDHATGRVRAFLCGHCNNIVGRCGEDIDHLVAVAEYLIRQKALVPA